MRLLLLKWFHKFMIRHDTRRRERLARNWLADRINLRRQYMRELRAIDGAISAHNNALTELEQERLWQMAERKANG